LVSTQTNDYIDISKKLVEAAKTQNQKAAAYIALIAKADEKHSAQLDGTPLKKHFSLMFTMVLQIYL
jgi:hypothetical protein